MSAGGGGWGDPLARKIELVIDDVENFKVSAESARDIYGVEILPNGDARETPTRLKFRAKLEKSLK
jgi:N-methylhydantoinase B